MTEITFIDRKTKKTLKEKVYGNFFLELLYGSHFLSEFLSFVLLPLVSKIPFFSYLYGAVQKSPFSRFKIKTFIENYHVHVDEFLDPVSSFHSFNDFFVRKLKPEARPLAQGKGVAILPADGRYLFFQQIDKADGFLVKTKSSPLRSCLMIKLKQLSMSRVRW